MFTNIHTWVSAEHSTYLTDLSSLASFSPCSAEIGFILYLANFSKVVRAEPQHWKVKELGADGQTQSGKEKDKCHARAVVRGERGDLANQATAHKWNKQIPTNLVNKLTHWWGFLLEKFWNFLSFFWSKELENEKVKNKILKNSINLLKEECTSNRINKSTQNDSKLKELEKQAKSLHELCIQERSKVHF